MAEPAQNKSSDAVIQTLKWIRKQGWKPVALHKRSKAAVSDKFADPLYVPPEDEYWTLKDVGIGVLCGPKMGGPLDVDIDCEEAGAMARYFLPPTAAVFGRASKLRSHYLYTVDVPEFAKKAFVDPISRSTIIELRGDGGHQTVFPGSEHEGTGEIIEWAEVAFPEVAKVEAAALDLAVKKIAIAVLIARHMWAEGQRNEVCKHLAGIFYYLDWTEEETKALIQTVMEYTGDDDRTRLRTVTITYKKGERGGKVTGSNTLKSFLGDARLVDRIMEWAGSESASLLQDFNERYAIVSVEGKFRIAETMVEKGAPPVLYAKEDFLNLMAPDTIENAEGKKVPKAAIWLANPRRRTYKSLDFIPGEEDTSPILNLWTGWALQPSEEGSCQAWVDLLYHTICGGKDDTYNWMMHWFANIVREPTRKSLTAPVLIGRQGAGKSLLIGYFGKLLGPAYVTVTNEEHIYGRFNKHLATALLLHSEEALYGGDRKHRGIIKSLITDEFRIFEQKGIDAKTVRNHVRLVLTSNEDWAAPAEVGDRRFTVIDMEDRKLPDSLVKAIMKEMNEGGPAKLFHNLLTMTYDPDLPRVNLKNAALASMKQINFDPIASWWHDTLRQGQVVPDYLAWATKPDKMEWPNTVSANALHTSLLVKVGRQRYIPTLTQFSQVMNKMTGTHLERKQMYFDNPMSDEAPREVKLLPSKQYTIVNLPDLATCRAAFCKYVGQELSWPDEPEEKPVHIQF